MPIKNRSMIAAALAVLFVPAFALAGPGDTITLNPTDDTFSRAANGTGTYGDAGALHVSGTLATNENGTFQRDADTWMRFDTTAAVNQFNATYGVGNWMISSAVLSLREQAFPNNALFTRGAGSFSVNWIANDDWSAGPGIADGPGVATGNQVGWNYGQSILDGLNDEALGIFQSDYITGRKEFILGAGTGFIADIASGGNDLSLRLAAADDTIGYTFNGIDVPQADRRPELIITAIAIPEPATMSLLALGGLAMIRRRR